MYVLLGCIWFRNSWTSAIKIKSKGRADACKVKISSYFQINALWLRRHQSQDDKEKKLKKKEIKKCAFQCANAANPTKTIMSSYPF
jgi:hypothetical protein